MMILFILIIMLIIWYFSDFFLIRNQEFLYDFWHDFKILFLMCLFNISISVSVKFFKIEKLETCHVSCRAMLIFCVRMISESIHHISKKSQAKHFFHQCRISIKNSCFSNHNSSSIYNLSMCFDLNLESQASCEKHEIMYVSY